MEKVADYKQKVVKVLGEIANWSADDELVDTQFIRDHENGHYLLFDVGWEGSKRIYLPFVHVDVTAEGKVWLQHDGTDLKIALLLYEAGIPKSDIVLGFHAPYNRELIPEFAVS